ncbi:hypothetical protein [Bogoriella caseilytica]|uniref:Uncharacterized protein n=1 Tax=Bogoriella caseilytica TaxID=56055 RepID=A0A3N2BDM0_9MICO|nr:hypothetical protein [Bogoriella caseilytica]ROR73350.1 hypothetical protein EDD31_1727 [Bogoriella caseilytica]
MGAGTVKGLACALGLLFAVFASGVAGSPAAATAQAPLEYSTDGRSWSATPPDLFGDDLLIPGSEVTSRFWVRHHGHGTARLALHLNEVGGAARAAPIHQWLRFRFNGHEVVPGAAAHDTIAHPGEATAVQLDIALASAAPPDTRHEQVQILSAISFSAVPDGAEPTPVPPDGAEPTPTPTLGTDPEPAPGPETLPAAGVAAPPQDTTPRPVPPARHGALSTTGVSVTVLAVCAIALLAAGASLRCRLTSQAHQTPR